MSSEKKASDASDLKKQTPSQMKSTPNMVSVVEEQTNDESIVHILPRAPMMEYSSSAATATDLDGEKMITGDTLKSVKNSANFTSNSELDRSKDSDKEALFDTFKLKSMSSMPDDANINLSLSEKIDAIHKKTIDPTRVVLKSVTDMKLKKATNPSISSLRAMSIQNNNNLNNSHPNSNNSSNFNSINHNNNNNNNNSNLNSNIPSNNNITSNNINNTVSSSSTTLTKGSTRAEIFAAKLHDAIKNDTNLNNDTVETFVYDTTTSNTTPMVESNYEHLEQYRNDESDQTKTSSRDTEFKEPANVERRTNSDGRSSINHFSNIQPVKEKLQNVFKNEPESPLSRKTIEDNFEVKSKSSMGSRRNSKRKPSRTFGDFTELHPKQKLEGDDNKSVNQLRQITSRLFDNKSIQLHKYSNNDDEFTNNDSFEDEMDYFDDSSYANYNYGNHNNNTQHHQPNTPTTFNYNKGSYSQPNPQSGNQYEVLYSNTDLDGLDDEELQSYLSTNYHSVNTGKSTYLGKPQHNFQEPNHHQLNHHNYLQQQQQQKQQQQHLNPNLQQPLHSNISSLPDYGSVIPDKKRRFWRTKDIYSSPHDFTSLRTQRIKQLKSFCYSVSIILLLLFLGFISGFILATNKELQDLEVLEIRNTIVSQEELVFDMVFSAFNPSLISIKVDTAQLDVFAKTKYAFSQKGDNTPYETILLGTIDTLEVPLIFEGGFLNRKKDRGSTQFKIVNPCSLDNKNVHKDKDKDKDKDILSQRVQLYGDKADDELEKSLFLQNIIEFNTPDDRWLNISRHPFDIIVRGALMYKLPLSSDNHTVSVSYTSYIDPHDDFID